MRRTWLMMLALVLFVGSIGLQKASLAYARRSLDLGRTIVAENDEADRIGRARDVAGVHEREALRATLNANQQLADDAFFAILAIVLALEISFMAWPVRRTGLLRVDGYGVSMDGELLVPRARVRQAVRFTSGSKVGVRIDRRRFGPSGSCNIELASDVDCEEVLAALSQDSKHATASFDVLLGGLRPSSIAFFVGLVGLVLVGALVFVRTSPSAPWFAGPTLFGGGTFVACTLAWLAVSRTLTVGVDGILVRSPFGRTTFHRYGSVKDVRVVGNDLLVEVDSIGLQRFGVYSSGLKLGDLDQGVTAEAVAMRIADARAALESGAATSDLANVLARSGREIRDWILALKEVLGGARTFRTSLVPPDRLWIILEDPTQPEAVRAGAALALREGITEEGKGRLRVAASTSASTELRRALEAIEADDEEAVAHALESVSPHDRRLRR